MMMMMTNSMKMKYTMMDRAWMKLMKMKRDHQKVEIQCQTIKEFRTISFNNSTIMSLTMSTKG